MDINDVVVVDIEHGTYANETIPFINSQPPLFKVKVYRAWLATITELGFKVTGYEVNPVVEEPVVVVPEVVTPSESVVAPVDAQVTPSEEKIDIPAPAPEGEGTSSESSEGATGDQTPPVEQTGEQDTADVTPVPDANEGATGDQTPPVEQTGEQDTAEAEALTESEKAFLVALEAEAASLKKMAQIKAFMTKHSIVIENLPASVEDAKAAVIAYIRS